jgi:hypothetical protein
MLSAIDDLPINNGIVEHPHINVVTNSRIIVEERFFIFIEINRGGFGTRPYKKD